MAGNSEIEIDLTELDKKFLVTLFWKLKNVDDEGNCLGKFAAFEHIDQEARLNSENLNLGQFSENHGEALRLYSEQVLMSPNLIAMHMLEKGIPDINEKSVLSLILEPILMEKTQYLQHFHISKLMEEYQVLPSEIIDVKKFLLDKAVLPVRQLLKEFPILSPSQLMISIAVMHAENSLRRIFDEAMNVVLPQKPKLSDADVISTFCAALASAEAQLTESHQRNRFKHMDIKQNITEVSNKMDELLQTVMTLDKKKQEIDASIRNQELKMIEENVLIIDEENPESSGILASLPPEYQERVKRPLPEDEDIQVLEAEPVEEKKKVSEPVPPKLPPLKIGNHCFARYEIGSSAEKWERALVIDTRVNRGQAEYRVQFVHDEKCEVKLWLDPCNVAYGKDRAWKIPEGFRVVAFNPNDKVPGYYAGIVGEKPIQSNRFRFLIFFDKGQVSYVEASHLRVVLNAKSAPTLREGWRLIPEKFRQLRTFMQEYLAKFPMRTMLSSLNPRERVEVERNGEWYRKPNNPTILIDKDCSLIKLRFPTQPPVDEWLYRGSPRLFLIYKTSNSQAQGHIAQVSASTSSSSWRAVRQPTFRPKVEIKSAHHISSNRRIQTSRKTTRLPDKPSEITLSSDSSPDSGHESDGGQDLVEDHHDEFALKFPGSARPLEPRGRIEHEFIPEWTPNRGPHWGCDQKCIKDIRENPQGHRNKSPFLIPLLYGWSRQRGDFVGKTMGGRNREDCYYVAPCGRRIRDAHEVTKYLVATNSKLSVYFFSFDPHLNPAARYEAIGAKHHLEDYAKGSEDIFISSVNCHDEAPPPSILYSKNRFPVDERVTIPAICSGCSCEDDCSTQENCECRILTREGVDQMKSFQMVLPPKKFWYGYCDGGLTTMVQSGIYECNANCRCARKNKNKCVNRLVQNGMWVPIQLFKTCEKGWGLRSLIDVPKGQFLCIYAGAILSHDIAEEFGKEMGDEYFADMDLIRILEDQKEGYEPDGPYESDEETKKDSSPKGMKEPSPKKPKQHAGSGAEDNLVPEMTDSSQEEGPEGEKKDEGPMSMSKYFGDEYVYTIDARRSGNIGRFINHSCDPNVFVQNVLVDTHDLRFPWTSFFSKKRIKAGEELAWDYNYEIGTVHGKVIICRCGAKNCRGRLL